MNLLLLVLIALVAVVGYIADTNQRKVFPA